jgi:hypothetical protein
MYIILGCRQETDQNGLEWNSTGALGMLNALHCNAQAKFYHALKYPSLSPKVQHALDNNSIFSLINMKQF